MKRILFILVVTDRPVYPIYVVIAAIRGVVYDIVHVTECGISVGRSKPVCLLDFYSFGYVQFAVVISIYVYVLRLVALRRYRLVYAYCVLVGPYIEGDISIPVGEHLIIVKAKAECVREGLLQVFITNRYVQWVSILFQRLHLIYGWLLGCACVVKIEAGLLGKFILEIGGREKVDVRAVIHCVAVEYISLPVAGIRQVATNVKHYFIVVVTVVNAAPVGENIVAEVVASSCNSPYMNSMIAWSAPGYTIEYKPTPYPYAFKPAKQNVAEAQSWQLYPNPASENITVTCPAAQGVKAGYEVENMMGQVVVQGSLEPGSQQINLAGIKPGNYLLKLHRDDGAGSQQMFVKD